VKEDAQPGVVADFDEAENLSPFTEEAKCNMTEAGEMCPVHGLRECGMYEEELDELTRRDFLRGAGAALGGAALAGVAGQAQAAAPGSSKPTAVSNVYSLEKVMMIRAICQAEAQGHRRVAGDKPDVFDLTVQKPPYFTGWFDPATIAKAEKVSVNALTNFSRKIKPAEYKEYLDLQFEAYRTVDGAYRSFADKDKKSAAKRMAFYEPIYKSLVQNAEQLANKLNEYTAVTYGQKTGLEESRCNMTEAGEMCPQHGMMECGMEGQDNSPLAGQYGHSGKMKPVDKDTTFLDRLRELSGMMRK
jgi:hypothetical protein